MCPFSMTWLCGVTQPKLLDLMGSGMTLHMAFLMGNYLLNSL